MPSPRDGGLGDKRLPGRIGEALALLSPRSAWRAHSSFRRCSRRWFSSSNSLQTFNSGSVTCTIFAIPTDSRSAGDRPRDTALAVADGADDAARAAPPPVPRAPSPGPTSRREASCSRTPSTAAARARRAAPSEATFASIRSTMPRAASSNSEARATRARPRFARSASMDASIRAILSSSPARKLASSATPASRRAKRAWAVGLASSWGLQESRSRCCVMLMSSSSHPTLRSSAWGFPRCA
mmetsp:Transcript_74923/g.207439  ORF Transcript_74923/g.207439 Transcript_74923/m.207439 type:complete len:241 (+) Transcript_74923:231-953(+)